MRGHLVEGDEQSVTVQLTLSAEELSLLGKWISNVDADWRIESP